jgi:formate-dependent phosphoribosylglycinamide formyltransferase (GAR transformylase)
MPTALLLDTNRAAQPLFQALEKRGIETWVAGGNPQDYLARVSSNYVNLDYSDQHQLETFIAQHQFDYLVPGCNDLSYEMCTRVNQGRYPGLDSLEVNLTLNNKARFRSFALHAGISVPQVVQAPEQSSTGKVIVKPVDSYSGRGMKVLDVTSVEAVNSAMEEARVCSRTSAAIMEEFVAGQLMSHSAFLRNKEVVADFVVREDCTAHPFTVDSSHVIHDHDQDQNMKKALRKDAQMMADLLGLKDGLLHTQFIVSEDKYWLIEVTRRCPGDLYSQLIEFSTGSPYADWYVKPFLGETVEPLYQNQGTRNIIRHTVSPSEAVHYSGLQFQDNLNISLFVPLAVPGDLLLGAPYGRAAIVFLEERCNDSMLNLYHKMLNRDLYFFHCNITP